MNHPKKRSLPAETKLLLRSIPSPVVSAFIIATISMNLLANKSISLPFDWLALDCGIIISWLIFLCMDIVTRRFGPRAATILSVFAILINLLICGIFLLGSALPGMWGEAYVDGMENIINTALNHTFGGTWYVLLGSSIAFFASAVVNNFTNWQIGVRLAKRAGHSKSAENSFGNFACRSWISTAVGQFADNLIFALIVSHHFFGWSLVQCFTCAATGAAVELLCEVLFSPAGYRICRKWEAENVGKDYIAAYHVRPAGSD